MADQKFQPQNTSQTDTDLFVKGMTKDPNASLVGQQNWSHARNLINNSKDGDVGTVGNEPANLQCGVVPYTIIGTIYLYGDKWVIYSTDNTSSEIGMFDDSECTYETIVNDPCLNFNKLHLITGASKENFDCSWQVYWDDGNNPSRTLNLDRIPWQLEVTSTENADCITYAPIEPKRLNCEWIRLAPLVDVPCVKINKNKDGGQLRNGSYQAFIAYTVNEQKVGDFIGISNVQPLFDHEDTAGSLDIEVTNLDKEFEFYMLVIVSNNQGQMQAKKIGLYSTEQTRIGLDFIDQKLESVPLSTIPLSLPVIEKSDKMYVVNDYLIRQGPYEDFDFNYQPIANNIQTHWVSTEYPADYYYNGGNKPTFMRDEQYAFFIRFVYNTGERSSSYHIPGRPPNTTSEAGTGLFGNGTEDDETRDLAAGGNVLSTNEPFWRVYNTASVESTLPGVAINSVTDDGGVVVSKGKMGYWQSTERYPATDPVRWADLCGKNIRHHKMPNELTDPNGTTQRNSNDGQSIYVLGVEFTNIFWPTDNQGQPIPNLVGYEILVGAREGNKSIIAKGLLRNMRQYVLDNDNEGGTVGLIANFPFNDNGDDPYHTINGCADKKGDAYGKVSRKDFYTFHSPETSFNRVYLNPFEVRSYGVSSGKSLGNFVVSEEHPGAKLLRNFSAIIAAIIGAGYAIQQLRGERVVKMKEAKVKSVAKDPGPIYDNKKKRKDNIKHGQITEQGFTVSGGTEAYTTGTGGLTGLFVDVDVTTTTYGLSYGPQIITQQQSDFGGTQEDDNDWNHGFGGDHRLEKGQTDSPNNEYFEATGDQAAGAQTADDTVGGAIVGQAGTTPDGAAYTYPSGATGEAPSTNILPLVGRESQMTFGSIAGPGASEERYMDESRKAQQEVAKTVPGSEGPEKQVEHKGSRFKSLPGAIEIAQSVMSFLTLMADGGQVIIDLIYNMASYQQHAIKYNGHGFYVANNSPSGGKYSVTDNFRATIDKARYVADSFQNIDSTHKVNNLFRPKTVVIKTGDDDDGTNLTLPENWGAGVTDNSRFLMSEAIPSFNDDNTGDFFVRRVAAHYGGLKVNFDNQYGQIDGIRQIPIRGCIDYFDPEYDSNINVINIDTETAFSTQLLFGGDCYIARYTEKSIKPFFWDFLYEQPDGFPYNYKMRQNSPCPMFWMNTEKYDMSAFVAPLINLNFDFSNDGGFGTGAPLPSGYYNLDVSANNIDDDDEGGGAGNDSLGLGGLFVHKRGYMYTHSNGIQDFFVESELNMALRDWEDRDGERHYDWLENTDIKGLFDAKIIKDGNFYKYDTSLTKSKLFSQLISFGVIQPRDYDPITAEKCYTHYPKRLMYSLQAQKEAKLDFWRVFLPNNYKDFKNQVNVIKPISKNGAIIFFPHLSPQMFQGVDQLTTDLNTKITIGDGGLFSSIPQTNVTNADLPHEYGSCESARSVINTPSGLFYISQAQGKVFQYGGQGITNIANNGMKQWFNKYLPSRLLASFPEIEQLDEIIDNPVVGVGCQSVYDPNYDIVYFCKRDFEPINPDCMAYQPGVGFIYNEVLCNGGNIEDAYEYECPPDTELIQNDEGEFVCQCTDTIYLQSSFTEGFTQYEGGWVTPEPTPCPLDIIVSVDASQSISENSNEDDMRQLLLGLVGHKVEGGVVVVDEDNPGFRPGIESGDVRIGFVGWSYRQIGMTTFAGDPYTQVDGPSPMQMLPSINAALNWIDNYYQSLNFNAGLTNHAAGLWDGLDMLYNPGWDIDGQTFQPDYNSDVQPSYEHARLGVQKLLIFVTDGLGNIGNSPSTSAPLADAGVMVDLPNNPPFQHTLRPNLTFPGSSDLQNRQLNNAVDDACKFDGNMGGCDLEDYIRGWQINGFMDQNEISDANDAAGIDDTDAQYARTETVRFKGLDGGYVGRGRCKNHLDQYYAVDAAVGIVIPTSPFDYSVDEYGEEGKIYTTPVMGSNWAPYSECDEGPYGISTIADNTDPSALGSELAVWWNNFVIGDINGTNPIASDNRKVIYQEQEVIDKWGELTVYPIYLKAAGDGAVTSQEIDYFEQYASHPKSENVATGNFNSDAIRDMIDGLVQRFCPPPERYWDPNQNEVYVDGTLVVPDCPPGFEVIDSVGLTDTPTSITCGCTLVTEPEITISGSVVSLDDPEYFRDVSWTVSYDPKIQGWLSFHDWHPELTLPSLNHFLTTKTGPAETPHCPDGYFFNEDGENAGLCCQDEQYSQLADNSLEYGEFTYNEDSNTTYTPGPVDFDTIWYRSRLQCIIRAASELCNNSYVAGIVNGFPQSAMGVLFRGPQPMNVDLPGPLCMQFGHNWEFATDSNIPVVGLTMLPESDPACPPCIGQSLADCANPATTWFDGFNVPFFGSGPENISDQWAATGGHPPAPPGESSYTGLHSGDAVYTGAAGVAYPSLPDEGLEAGNTYVAKVWLRTIHRRYNSSGVDTVGCGGPFCSPAGNIWGFQMGWGSPAFFKIIGGNGSFGAGEIGDDSYDVLDNINPNNEVLAQILVNDENSNNFDPDNIADRFDWVEYEFTFTPTQDFECVALACQIGPDPVGPYDGFVMASNFRIYRAQEGTSTTTVTVTCDCEEGYEMVDNLGNPTDICRETNQCVKVVCDCPEVDGNTPVSQEGNCDTLKEYLGINTNPLPLTCYYDFVSCVEPSLEIGGIWKHNVRCDLFANYYTKQYPWEIELVSSMGQTVEMLRSVEYQLEVFDYITNYAKDATGNDILEQPLNLNCEDRYQELFYNFNEAIVSNNEQISGLLKLEIEPTNPPLITTYPIIGASDIRILYSKVEQLFRFDQFWDITDNRNIARTQYITQMNGYIRDLNEENINYDKPELQRKKFRNYFNKVLLRRMPIEAGYDNDGNVIYEPETKKMLLKLVNTKLNHSFR